MPQLNRRVSEQCKALVDTITEKYEGQNVDAKFEAFITDAANCIQQLPKYKAEYTRLMQQNNELIKEIESLKTQRKDVEFTIPKAEPIKEEPAPKEPEIINEFAPEEADPFWLAPVINPIVNAIKRVKLSTVLLSIVVIITIFAIVEGATNSKYSTDNKEIRSNNTIAEENIDSIAIETIERLKKTAGY